MNGEPKRSVGVTREALLIEEEREEGRPSPSGFECAKSSTLDALSGDLSSSRSLDGVEPLLRQGPDAAVALPSQEERAFQPQDEGNATSTDSELSNNGSEGTLSPVENAYLVALLQGANPSACLEGESEDIVVDSINEKLFDLLGDTALEYGEVGPQIIEDYLDEIQEVVGQ